MARPTDTQRLANYQRRYDELAAQIADIGYIASGTILSRHTKCGTKACRCHADPPRLHGPYWQLTKKQAGKTITRHLNNHEMALYQEWIDNDRELQRVITELRKTAAKATKLLLKNAGDQPAKV